METRIEWYPPYLSDIITEEIIVKYDSYPIDKEEKELKHECVTSKI